MTQFCLRVHHAGFSYPDLTRLARSAERLGFHGMSLYDVLNPRALEVWTALTALTVATRSLVFMPLVLNAAYRHPVMLAKMAAGLDAVGGGNRLILGLGYGGEATAYGFEWRPRVSARVEYLEEQAQILRGLWTEPTFSFAGKWFELTDATGFPTATPGGPPLLIASRGIQYGLGGVARRADLSNVSFDLSPSEWQEYQSALAEHLASSGRPANSVGLTHNATVIIRERRADALRAFESFASSRNLTQEQARHGLDHALVGTPEDIITRLQSYSAAGVNLAWVFCVFPDLPATRSVRLFAEGVLPAFRAARS